MNPSARTYGMQRQLAVYMAGLSGERPKLPMDPVSLEQAASAAMSREASGYLDGMPDTMRASLEAFRRWRIVPRMLRIATERDLTLALSGYTSFAELDAAALVRSLE